MSKRNGSNLFTQNLPRLERRRRAREARKKLQSPDERQLLVKEGLSSLAHQTGLASLMRLMEQDADRVCGVKGKWEQNREGRIGSRNGWGPGTVWLGGSCVQIQRPRAVRAKSLGGGELSIESYQQAQNPEFLSNAALTATMLGVSLRNHAKVVGAINPVTQEGSNPIFMQRINTRIHAVFLSSSSFAFRGWWFRLSSIFKACSRWVLYTS